eukprot:CAMPEP_0174252988 /NCGR_PEP_ID=MMETSP0439-20130205/2381_1 /TAXON_ID=0 /ORGANISM="Stereomyxa ramosa, Strain Chinc5" /LENGTH=440 /DNA_ID=CAMNT_0015333763 /DNA_START=23 /DNA_END=1342 /DNA_ORIENTATION=-
MPLEATLFLVDNSEWMRNGDYYPTRMEAQLETLNVLMNRKFGDNVENVVGAMTMAKSPNVLLAPTTERSAVLSALHSVTLDGEIDLISSIRVAQLALKHRQNKNQHQRMIIFVGSPLKGVDSKALRRLGAQLKKNHVAADVISFGEIEENDELLKTFAEAVNSKEDNSCFVSVEPANVPRQILERVRNSNIYGVTSTSAPSEAASGVPSGGDFGGLDFDPNMDPELAMAIRASLEEERQRQQRQQEGEKKPETEPHADKMDVESKDTTEAAKPEQPAASHTDSSDQAEDINDEDDDEDDADLQAAIAMSMQAALASAEPKKEEPKKEEPKEEPKKEEPKKEEPKKEEPSPMETEEPEKKPESTEESYLTDPNFMQSVLSTLPGVDMNDPTILALIGGGGEKEKEKEKEEKKEEKKEDEKKEDEKKEEKKDDDDDMDEDML